MEKLLKLLVFQANHLNKTELKILHSILLENTVHLMINQSCLYRHHH